MEGGFLSIVAAWNTDNYNFLSLALGESEFSIKKIESLTSWALEQYKNDPEKDSKLSCISRKTYYFDIQLILFLLPKRDTRY